MSTSAISYGDTVTQGRLTSQNSRLVEAVGAMNEDCVLFFFHLAENLVKCFTLFGEHIVDPLVVLNMFQG